MIWEPNTFYMEGAKVGEGKKAINSGVSGSVEPIWPEKEGETVIDGQGSEGIVWQTIYVPSKKK